MFNINVQNTYDMQYLCVYFVLFSQFCLIFSSEQHENSLFSKKKNRFSHHVVIRKFALTASAQHCYTAKSC